MLDVIVAGAGPAGSIAALLLARAGARVLVIDRAAGPRPASWIEALSPRAIEALAALDLAGGPVGSSPALAGVRVSGPRAHGRLAAPQEAPARVISRGPFDAWLLDAAIRAGARFEPGLMAQRALLDNSASPEVVRGLVLRSRRARTETRLPASLVIAADGARSTLARSLGLCRPAPAVPVWIRRTQITGLDGGAAAAELHCRRGWRLRVLPLATGAAGVSLIRSAAGAGPAVSDGFRGHIARDAALSPRWASAARVDVTHVTYWGAASTHGAGVPGLLAAGDACGPFDPLAGDGLFHAIASARVAAAEGLRVLETGDAAGAVGRLNDVRERLFGRMRRLDRLSGLAARAPTLADALVLSAGIWPRAAYALATYVARADVSPS